MSVLSASRALPDPLSIRPRPSIDAAVEVPGSRSLTNRALLAAALAEPAGSESQLAGALTSDDTEAMREGLEALGARIEVAPEDAAKPGSGSGPAPGVWRVISTGGRLRAPSAPLDARASGTTARFLTAAAVLAPGPVGIDGAPRMRERPIADLVHGLEQLGARIEVQGRSGCPPLRVLGGGIEGGPVTVDARRSSQYVSAILLVAPYARRDVTLTLAEGVLVSRPYVELTLGVMEDFGAQAGWTHEGALRVEAGRPYRARSYRVEPDASSAAYPFAAAAITGGRVRVDGLPAASRQADVGFLDVLARMGCAVERRGDRVEVRGPRQLRAIDADMNAMPDAALALAVVALFADGPSRIRNVANLRIKESDRLHALETELRKLGAAAHAGPDSIRIEPGRPRPAVIDTYEDHRIAMAFALAGLRIPGVAIRDPGCVAKTWPDYFGMLERL